VCWTAIEPAYDVCFPCYTARRAFRAQDFADVVVPIAPAVKREQLAHELWHYKYDTDATVRARLEVQLAAVLWRFLGLHEAHVAQVVGGSQFDIVTTVPGTKERDDEHPLARRALVVTVRNTGLVDQVQSTSGSVPRAAALASADGRRGRWRGWTITGR
jgi:hypothetical protein